MLKKITMLVFVFALSAIFLVGCAEKEPVDGNTVSAAGEAVKACAADCAKPCCDAKVACPADCTMPCCAAKAPACPADCTKPCCATKS